MGFSIVQYPRPRNTDPEQRLTVGPIGHGDQSAVLDPPVDIGLRREGFSDDPLEHRLELVRVRCNRELSVLWHGTANRRCARQQIRPTPDES